MLPSGNNYYLMLWLSILPSRLLWCPSPYASAELFEELKVGRPQPSAEVALTVKGSGSAMPEWNDKYSHGPQVSLTIYWGSHLTGLHRIHIKYTKFR